MKIKALILGLVIATSGFASSDKWEFVSDDQGVKVWQQDVPGTSVFKVISKATINQPMGKIVAVINDPDPALKMRWVDMLTSVKFINNGKWDRKEYHDYTFPWPASNRDLVVQYKTTLDAPRGAVHVTVDSIDLPEYPKEKTTGVRGEAHFNYTLTYLGPNKTGIEVEAWADPRGMLPKFMVNMVNRKWPTKTLTALERETAASKLPPDPEIEKMLAEYSKSLAH